MAGRGRAPLTAASSLRLGIEGAGYYQGNSFGPTYDLQFLTVGPVYMKRAGHTTYFADALVGLAHLNGATGPSTSATNVTIPRLAANYTLAFVAGGGVDFRVTRRMKWQVSADYLHTNFTSVDDQIHNIVDSNVRVSTGVEFRF
jgi:opacity protein-like surface antigen